MSGLWDSFARTQDIFSKYKQTTGPFNADKKLKFGVALDLAKNTPANPTYYSKTIADAKKQWSFTTAGTGVQGSGIMDKGNNAVETGRQALLEVAGATLGKPIGIPALTATGAAVGSVVPVFGTAAGGALGFATGTAMFGIAELDKKTDGKVSNALMSGTKGLRSNYAFVSDVAKHDAALGFWSTLALIGAGVAGTAAVIASGGTAAPAVAAGFLAMYGAGKAQRVAAEAGVFDSITKNIKASAILSQSSVGQERYNFGNDAMHLASAATGWKTLGDTTKGIGAIGGGILNFTAELTAPDIKGVQFAGKLARQATVGGITTKTDGPIVGLVERVTNEPARATQRLADDVEVIKKTVAGEKTVYSPLIKFLQENDVATIQQRVEYRGNEVGQIGIPLVAGKSVEEIGLVLRISRGDKTALEELSLQHPSTFAQLMRYEGMIETIQQSGNQRVAYGFTRADGSNIVLSKKLTGNTAMIEAELLDLQSRFSNLNKMLKLDSSMQERTASRVRGVESLRNDIAKQRAANKLGNVATDLTTRETLAGKVMQKIYTDNSLLGVTIRKIDRALDDAPHQTVNFNDMVTGTSRLRTTTRAAVDRQLMAPEEGRLLYNSFITAKTEVEKLAALEKFEVRIFEQLGNKHGVAGMLVDQVLKEYLTITAKNKAKAVEAKAANKAYMIDEVGDVIVDPQLISQLANGHYLPDIELLDKAFARYAKKMGKEASLPVNMAILGLSIVDEFQSLWRSITLARTGFPINIMRDSTLRAWGDGALFYMVKDMATTAVGNIVKSKNDISEIQSWTKTVTNKNSNLKYIRQEMSTRDAALKPIQDVLKRAGYDPANPKTLTPEIQKVLDYQKQVQSIRDGLSAREQQLVAGKPEKVVGRNAAGYFGVDQYQFPRGGAGQFGKMSYDKLRGKEDLRGLLASSRELDMANIRRDRVGGHKIEPTQFNEKLHLKSWETILNNSIKNDPVARFILGQKMTEKEIITWIRSEKSTDYVERFGYDPKLKRNLKYSDAEYIYNRVLNAVNQFAPETKLWKPIMDDTLDVNTLKKLFPSWQERPTIVTDLAEDLLGTSSIARNMSNLLKDVVTWMATVPTSVLSYQPYFNAKYQHKLQNMVALANQQGRKLSDMDQKQFEAVARAHAMSEYRGKINAFNRDMNYPAMVNYIMAFFPAVVEQYRAYGKITMENPEFPLKILAMSRIPEYIGDVQIDQYGTEYVEVDLPLLGIKGRLPSSWFNAVNPTGGHILSAGPVSAFTVNVLAKQVDLPKIFVDTVLPFGVQANNLNSLTPGQLRRAGQAFQSFVLKNGEQYNKDVNMFIEMKRFDFQQDNHRQPNANEVDGMYKRSRKDATKLAILRSVGAGILPAQPQYVSPIQVYADLLGKYMTEYGADGAERFTNDYPDYFLLVDKLTDSTSGIRSDDTAVGLVKKNTDVIEKMVAGRVDLRALGAVFNDDDYAFSSTAQAYLVTNAIPGTKQKFKEQGAALENNTSSIVSNGWKQWNKLIETVTQELINNDPPYDVSHGYGAAVLDTYKKNFLEVMKTQNNLWYEEKIGAGYANRQNDTVKVLTIAANTPKLWADLAKQPRWHSVVEYLNFRYEIYDALKARGTTINTAKATDIAMAAKRKVAELRRTDVNFGKFYDRYFDGDEFSYIYEEQPAIGSK